MSIAQHSYQCVQTFYSDKPYIIIVTGIAHSHEADNITIPMKHTHIHVAILTAVGGLKKA